MKISHLLGWGGYLKNKNDFVTEVSICRLKKWCEEFQMTDAGWNFRMNLSELDRVNVQQGDFEDFLREQFSTLFDLKKFYDAEFTLWIILNERDPKAFTLSPIVVSICASLGMDIEIQIDTEDTPSSQ